MPLPGSPLNNAANLSPEGPPGYAFLDPLFPPGYHPPSHTVDPAGVASLRPDDGQLDIGAFENRIVWYVDDGNQTGTENGTASYPFSTIQDAIDTCGSGDSVFVAQGTYTENCVISAKTVSLSGGFFGGDPGDYASGSGGDFSIQDPVAYITLIQAQLSSAAVTFVYTGASGSEIDGFEITGGYHGILTDDELTWPLISDISISRNDIHHNGVEDDLAHRGGGLLLAGTGFVVTGNTIRQNSSGRGAGLAADVEDMVIHGNLIEQNVGYEDHGGGLYLSGSQTITGNIIRFNRTGEDLGYGWGGGILILGTVSMSGNDINNNFAPSIGGGVFIDEGGVAILRNELIHYNTTSEHDKGGAGIYVDGGMGPSHADIANCTLAMNTAPGTSGGNGVYVEGSSSATVRDCIFQGNSNDDFYVESGSTLTVTYSMSEEAWSGTGNVVGDPLFADAAAADFHLKSLTGRWHSGSGMWVTDTVQSPAIDRGDPASAFGLEPAPNGARVNMGAYGNTAYASLSWSVLHCRHRRGRVSYCFF